MRGRPEIGDERRNKDVGLCWWWCCADEDGELSVAMKVGVAVGVQSDDGNAASSWKGERNVERGRDCRGIGAIADVLVFDGGLDGVVVLSYRGVASK